ncbi:MAG: DUF763 domain-containing protein, partial [Pseudomonadota bacterium]
MKNLAREITIVIVREFGPEEMLEKLSDPFWFQAFGCVLGFDWHSSGLTTTVCGALKEGIRELELELGLFVAGGKGKASRQTPSEIRKKCETISLEADNLIYASRMSAKVDSSAIQDGYQVYHHCFLFTKKGQWGVIQQGMNQTNRLARRYHWNGRELEDFVQEPHSAICCDLRGNALNMVAKESGDARDTVTSIAAEKPDAINREVVKLQRLDLPNRHQVLLTDLNPNRLKKILLETYERQPENFETLLGMRGIGPKTIRALSFISELVYGVKSSFRVPARFCLALGGN